MKKIVELILKFLAKLILGKYKPEIIGITGSVGKTGTKEAVYTVLRSKFNVRRNIKNYNNEIGLPLTIIGAETVGRSIIGWLIVFFKGLKLIIFTDCEYPKILVLEMGVDKPGDMNYLNSIVKCKIGIATAIGSVHAENFGTTLKLYKEKTELIKSIDNSGWSILNYDDEKTRAMKSASKAKVITYGLDDKADIRAAEIKFNFFGKEDSEIQGISFKLKYKKLTSFVSLKNVLGTGAVYSALAASAAGIFYKMDLSEISKALLNYKSPKGRMNLIKGIKHTMIIDDSYNAEPKSTMSALGAMKIIPVEEGRRKFAVLGDMLELGSYSESGHREVGKYAVKYLIDKLILVGERARDIGHGAEEAGMKVDNIFHFDNSRAAGKFVQERIKEGDLILVKGSQGMRMEKIVKEIMAEPLNAEKLLVRQDKNWLRK
ncbi:hypothetical protein DRH27_02320 [Candidatus Falkowbacteria bacterium]|nr:MAG: hypothetical protein DRH27_02320 [Candidatus Falkowbacteria bacterium]